MKLKKSKQKLINFPSFGLIPSVVGVVCIRENKEQQLEMHNFSSRSRIFVLFFEKK